MAHPERPVSAKPVPATSVLEALETIAPLRLAADWDRVGLLIEPSSVRSIGSVLCAIDLTETVLDEAVALGAQMIVAYHPPIFRGLDGLRVSQPPERVAVRCVESAISVYSPHTAWDAVEGGATDWLCDGLDRSADRRAIEPTADATDARTGHGRLVEFEQPRPLDELLDRIRTHLGLDRLRVARSSASSSIRSVAVCPGAGSSVLEQVRGADLWWTGEMRHHDALAAIARGTTVVLSEHSLTERGSLQRFASRLSDLLPGLSVHRSEVDRDPIGWE